MEQDELIPKKIIDWCEEYNVPYDRLSFEYADLGLTVAGDCTFWASSCFAMSSGQARARIRVHEALRGSPCEEDTWWHEYCHWEEYYRYGGSSAHGERWKGLYDRRSYPWYYKLWKVVRLLMYRFKR